MITAPETTVRQHADSIVDDHRNDICACWHRSDLCGVHDVFYRAAGNEIWDLAYSAYRAAAKAYGYEDDYNLHVSAEAFADRVAVSTS